MVVKTKFSKKEIEKILENYNIGRLVSYRGFQTGAIQTTYLIETAKGKYALRYYDERGLKQIQVEIEFLIKLEKTKIPYTRITRTKNKQSYVNYKKSAVLITKFLEGKQTNKNKKTYAKQLGLIAGKIHNISRNLKHRNYKSKWTYDYDLLNKLFNSRKRELKSKFRREHKAIINEAIKKIKTIDKIKLPKGMNHGDLLHDDILIKNDKVSGVLDFDDCFYGYLLCDLAEILAFWCIDNKVHFDFMKEAIRNYEKNRRLAKLEKENIYIFILLMLSIMMLYETYNTKYPNSKMKSFKLLDRFMKIPKQEFDKRLR